MNKIVIIAILSSHILFAQNYSVDGTDKACESDRDCISMSIACCNTGEMDAVSQKRVSIAKTKYDQFCRKQRNDSYNKQMSEYQSKKDAVIASCKTRGTCPLPILKIQNLCDGKQSIPAYSMPNAPTTCSNKVCTLVGLKKEATGTFKVDSKDQSCQKDFDCEIISLDCCLTGLAAIAVNKLRMWPIKNEHRKYCQGLQEANGAQRQSIITQLQAIQNQIGTPQDKLQGLLDQLKAFKGLCAEKYQSFAPINLKAVCADKVCKIK